MQSLHLNLSTEARTFESAFGHELQPEVTDKHKHLRSKPITQYLDKGEGENIPHIRHLFYSDTF